MRLDLASCSELIDKTVCHLHLHLRLALTLTEIPSRIVQV